jgi:hypothetical protein
MLASGWSRDRLGRDLLAGMTLELSTALVPGLNRRG